MAGENFRAPARTQRRPICDGGRSRVFGFLILHGRWLTDALFLLFLFCIMLYIISPMVLDDGGR